MKKYKIIYHIGDKPTLKTKVKKGFIFINDNEIVLRSKTENLDMRLNKIHSVSLFMLNGLGSMLEIQQEEMVVFLSVSRLCIAGQFAIINRFGTRKLKTEIERINSLQ